MFTNSDQLASGLKTLFMKEFDNYADIDEEMKYFYRLFHRFGGVTTKTSNFGWLGNVPQTRVWRGGREAGDILKYSYNVTQVKYENTIKIDRDEFELYDEYGTLPPVVSQMAEEANEHILREGVAFLETSFSANCYDGQFMCDDDHSEGKSGTQSNLGSAALSSATFAAGRLAMMGFKDDQGRIVPKKPDLLIVPPALGETAFHLMNDDYYPHASTTPSNKNRWKGICDIWECGQLSDADDWWLAKTNQGLPPMFIAIARMPEFTSLNDERAKHEGIFEFGFQSNFVCGFGDWRKLYGASV